MKVRGSLVFMVLSFCLSVNSGRAAEILDQGTQRNGMHSCPVGMFVTGVHVERNKLLCADGYGNYSQETIDRNTQSQGMHACPRGLAVTGIHAGKNLLACAPFDESRVEFGKAGWAPMVDKTTRRQGMHACPHTRPVLGIQVKKNLLLCIGPGQE
jgi:hypothetical protein